MLYYDFTGWHAILLKYVIRNNVFLKSKTSLCLINTPKAGDAST